MSFRSNRRIGLYAATFLSAGALLALPLGGAHAETLASALISTYQNNPTLQAARSQLRATNERVPQALSNWRPQVSVDSSIGRQKVKDEDNFSTVKETTTPKTVSLSVQQPLYRGGQTVAGTERAEFEVKSERNRLMATEQDVFNRAVESYLNVWQDREVLRLNKENVRALRDQLDATEERFQRGVATRTDVAQAESRLALAKAQRENTQGRLINSLAVYEEIIGTTAGELSYPEDMADLPASLDSAVAQAAESNPQVLAARFASRAADKEVRQRTGQLLPTVSVSGEVSRREEALLPSDETTRGEVRMRLQIPLYQAGRVTSQVRQAKQTASQRRLETAQAERRARQQARSAWGRLEAARMQIAERRAQVEAARIALQGTKEELNVGSRTVIEVLDAEQELFNAQISEVRAQRELAVARFNVLNAVGTLTARDLALDVPYYDPQDDYEAVRDAWWSLSAPGATSPEVMNASASNESAQNADKTDQASGDQTPEQTDTADTMDDGTAPSGSASSETASESETEAEPEADANAQADAEPKPEPKPEKQAQDTAAADDNLSVAEMTEIEARLSKLNFSTGAIDGRMDPTTRSAIGQFQRAAGLQVTHKPNTALMNELREASGDLEN